MTARARTALLCTLAAGAVLAIRPETFTALYAGLNAAIAGAAPAPTPERVNTSLPSDQGGECSFDRAPTSFPSCGAVPAGNFNPAHLRWAWPDGGNSPARQTLVFTAFTDKLYRMDTK
eukprot:gene8534-7793_t